MWQALAASKNEIETKMHEVLDEYDELRKAYSVLQDTNREMKVAMINLEEEASEWKRSYESLQVEGRELFQTYERKCTALKQVSQQLEEAKAGISEKEQMLKTLKQQIEGLTEEERELKAKCHTQAEAASKHEMRYLSLKTEHQQTLAMLDSLNAQLTELRQSQSEQPAGCSPSDADASSETGTHDSCTSGNGRVNGMPSGFVSQKQEISPKVHVHGASLMQYTTPVRPRNMSHIPQMGAKTPGRVLKELEEMSPASMRCVSVPFCIHA